VNLFWSTRRLTELREDHLTEFFAAALEYVPSFRTAYAELVLATFAGHQGWSPPVINRVETQTDAFAGAGCRPDMVLFLGDGRHILCEHKVDAPETPGAEGDDGQLARYLALPVDGVIYVRRSWCRPGASVLAHPKYVQPVGREHFLWSDFFPLLGPEQHVLVDWLREGFEKLGYTPPNPNIGVLTLRPEGDARQAMEDFAKLWGRVRSSAAALGWSVQSGSRIQLYLVGHPTSSVAQVFASPESQGSVLVRFTPRDASRLEEVQERVTAAAAALAPFEGRVRLAWGNWKGARVRVVEVRATRDAVFGREHAEADALEERLRRIFVPLLSAVT
jgi:hypothetical protein